MPLGDRARRQAAMNSGVRHAAGTSASWNVSRTRTSHSPARRSGTTRAASPTRMRSLGARGRSNHSRTRWARMASISTASWVEPGRAASQARARAQPAPPRWTARTGSLSPRSAVSAASICWRYSKSRCSGSCRSIHDDSAPSSRSRIPRSRTWSSAVANEVITGSDGSARTDGDSRLALSPLRVRVPERLEPRGDLGGVTGSRYRGCMTGRRTGGPVGRSRMRCREAWEAAAYRAQNRRRS